MLIWVYAYKPTMYERVEDDSYRIQLSKGMLKIDLGSSSMGWWQVLFFMP